MIKDGNFFEYYSIEKEITDALKTNEIEPEKFTAEQKNNLENSTRESIFTSILKILILKLHPTQRVESLYLHIGYMNDQVMDGLLMKTLMIF